jgi:hypothetical protein
MYSDRIVNHVSEFHKYCSGSTDCVFRHYSRLRAYRIVVTLFLHSAAPKIVLEVDQSLSSQNRGVRFYKYDPEVLSIICSKMLPIGSLSSAYHPADLQPEDMCPRHLHLETDSAKSYSVACLVLVSGTEFMLKKLPFTPKWHWI